MTTCTLAGMQFGYALLWTLVFATVGTIVLQEMSARLGVVGGMGLGEAIRRRFDARRQGTARLLAVLLIVGAIGIGNAAYQTGNILGAALGAQAVLGGDIRAWALAIALLATALLWIGSYKVIERAMVAMVVLMSIVFLVTAAATARDPAGILIGSFWPRLPDRGPLHSAALALGLVGTTIVPYNLFLHASAARERWRGPAHLGEARADLVVAIALGGLVSMAIVITAAAAPGGAGGTVAGMAAQLEPLLGRWATVFFATGLFAAGLTSAITAPLAAAYAFAGVFGWVSDLRSPLLRGVWILVMATGTGFALAGVRPVPAIVFAQAANGILLPAVAIFLLLVMNDRRLLKGSANGPLANTLGSVVVVLTAALGAWALWRVVHA